MLRQQSHNAPTPPEPARQHQRALQHAVRAGCYAAASPGQSYMHHANACTATGMHRTACVPRLIIMTVRCTRSRHGQQTHPPPTTCSAQTLRVRRCRVRWPAVLCRSGHLQLRSLAWRRPPTPAASALALRKVRTVRSLWQLHGTSPAEIKHSVELRVVLPYVSC